MFQKILVGVDASDESNRALRMSAKLAKIFRAELHIFHAVARHLDSPFIKIPLIVPVAVASSAGYGFDSTTLHESSVQAGKDIIADAKAYIEQLQLGLEAQCSYHLEIDVSPEEFALDFAKKKNVDLIVLGCKGHHSRLRQVILGTVASKILNDAPCQVLIVR